jgi:septal ring-binding cell division protein DamX
MALVARALTTTCRQLEHRFHILIGVFVLVLLLYTLEANASYQARNSAASGN